MKYSFKKLQDRIDERFGSMTEFAKAMGVPEKRLLKEMQKDGGLTVENIGKAANLLEIPACEVDSYFFSVVTEVKEQPKKTKKEKAMTKEGLAQVTASLPVELQADFIEYYIRRQNEKGKKTEEDLDEDLEQLLLDWRVITDTLGHLLADVIPDMMEFLPETTRNFNREIRTLTDIYCMFADAIDNRFMAMGFREERVKP